MRKKKFVTMRIEFRGFPHSISRRFAMGELRSLLTKDDLKKMEAGEEICKKIEVCCESPFSNPDL